MGFTLVYVSGEIACDTLGLEFHESNREIGGWNLKCEWVLMGVNGKLEEEESGTIMEGEWLGGFLIWVEKKLK